MVTAQPPPNLGNSNNKTSVPAPLLCLARNGKDTEANQHQYTGPTLLGQRPGNAEVVKEQVQPHIQAQVQDDLDLQSPMSRYWDGPAQSLAYFDGAACAGEWQTGSKEQPSLFMPINAESSASAHFSCMPDHGFQAPFGFHSVPGPMVPLHGSGATASSSAMVPTSDDPSSSAAMAAAGYFAPQGQQFWAVQPQAWGEGGSELQASPGQAVNALTAVAAIGAEQGQASRSLPRGVFVDLSGLREKVSPHGAGPGGGSLAAMPADPNGTAGKGLGGRSKRRPRQGF